ncbi:MAG: hypothetical protein AB8F34_16325 [Akkermansiaceae bacterium]
MSVFSALLVSCATSNYEATGVSDIWLDTPVRKSDAPKRPQSTLTDLKISLPSVAHVSSLKKQPWPSRVSTRDSEIEIAQADAPRQLEDIERSLNGVAASRYYSDRQHSYPINSPRPPYERKVEKVGPSIVPRPPVSLSTRSYTGGSRILPRRGVSIVPTPPQKSRDKSFQCQKSR